MSATQQPNTQTVLDAYVECALWASIDEQPDGNGGPPMDDNYGPDDIAPEALASMREDVEAFLHHADPRALECWAAELGEAQIGHDFWLTRNHHGAGFWDRFTAEPQASYGRHLTEAAEAYGSCDLYVGDDGKVYAS